MDKDNKRKAELLNRLEDAKRRLRSLVSEDKNDDFNDALDEVMRLKWEVDFKPAMVQVNEDDVVRKVDSETFYIAETHDSAVFHTYGGYTLIADRRNGNTLFTIMCELAEYLEDPESYVNSRRKEMVDAENAVSDTVMTAEEEETFVKKMRQSVETDFTVREFLMKLPWWCFCDISATYGIAESAYKEMKGMLERASVGLSEEDDGLNDVFESAMYGAETLSKEINK